MKRSFLVVIIVVLIITVGIFGNHLASFYTIHVIQPLFNFFSIDYFKVESKFLFATMDGKVRSGLGVFLYYGTYLVLHLTLIRVAFFSDKYIYRVLMIGLISMVFFLATLAMILKYFEFHFFGNYVKSMFHSIIAKPLILFLIEGSGLVYKYVNKMFDE